MVTGNTRIAHTPLAAIANARGVSDLGSTQDARALRTAQSMASSSQKPDTIAYRHLGSCSVQTWGGYVHVYRRDGEYRGDVAFFDGDRPLADLKEMHEALGRAIAVLEVQQATDKSEAERAVKTRFDRDVDD